MRECRHPNIVLFLGLCKEPSGEGRVLYANGLSLMMLTSPASFQNTSPVETFAVSSARPSRSPGVDDYHLPPI